MGRLADRLKDALLVTAACVVALLLAEGALALLGYGALYQSGVSRLHDDRLLYRLPANFAPDIDDAGYRNPERLQRYDIVAIGDSHTYGYNVLSEEAWPQQLGRIVGASVYNMGMGGRGPAQYLAVADEALAFRPRWLVVGFYMGNDLADACHAAHRLDYWRQWYAERGLLGAHCGAGASEAPRARSLIDGVKAWVKSTRLGSLLDRHVGQPLRARLESAEGALAAAPGGHASLVDPSFYETADASAEEGARLSTALFALLHDAAAAGGARLAVLFIPSKLAALEPWLPDRPPGAEAALAGERMQQARLEAALDGLGVPHASALPRLRALLARGERVYPPGRDDHPFAVGQRAYADAAAEAIGWR